MSFLIACPLCGPREVGEYRYGGEVSARPSPGAPPVEWSAYLYERTNIAGPERAWWFHRAGCRRWLQVERDTQTNVVTAVSWAPVASASNATAEGTGDG